MESNNKVDAVEKDALVLVITEFTEEQSRVNTTLYNLSTTLDNLTNKMEVLEGKMKEFGLNKPGYGLDQELFVRKSMKELKGMIQDQPKIIVRKYQFLLFPERDAPIYYKLVFGRWYLFLFLMVVITRLYSFGIHWTDNSIIVRIEQEKNAAFRMAWVSFYHKKGKKVKAEMDSIFLRVR